MFEGVIGPERIFGIADWLGSFLASTEDLVDAIFVEACSSGVLRESAEDVEGSDFLPADCDWIR